MPELPEVEGLARWLDGRIRGEVIRDVRLRSVAALKTYDPPLSVLSGVPVTGVGRRGKYVIVVAGDLSLVIHLSRGGWLRWRDTIGNRKPALRGPLIAEVLFGNHVLDITEHGKEKRLALWVVHDVNDVPQVSSLGPDALDAELTPERFAELIRSERGTIKTALADQRLIAGVGNAYSDEILHVARLSPFTRTTKLTDDDLSRLYQQMRSVLTEAVDRASGLSGADLKDDKRSNLRVHARAGQLCPVCGDTVREVWSASRSFQYCPGCQTGGRIYADRRLSRLLK